MRSSKKSGSSVVRGGGMLFVLLLVLAWPRVSLAQDSQGEGNNNAWTDILPDGGWPQQFSYQGNTLTIYQPQIESWGDDVLKGRAAVSITTPASPQPTFGVAWFSARTEVDEQTRLVALESVQVERTRFPEAGQAGTDAQQVIQKSLPNLLKSIGLDRLEADLTITKAETKTREVPVKNEPPRIIFSTTPSVLVLIDGPPALRQVSGTGLLRVINTRALLLLDQGTGTYYLYVADRWMKAPAVEGPWSVTASYPPELDAVKKAAVKNEEVQLLSPDQGKEKTAAYSGVVPTVYVNTGPATLLQTEGKPDFRSISGTQLLAVTNTSDDIFLDVASQDYYVLLSGRWFASKSMKGPWQFVPGDRLPTDFSRIPESDPLADVLASVSGTPQAEEAAIANSVPQTATVSRKDATLSTPYDGDPKFEPIQGTPLAYAVNCPIPIIRVSGPAYYAVQNGVWFVSDSPEGPWTVADHVPAVIYTIPPNCPVYYVTYVRVYGATPDVVYVGYTPGYLGSYIGPGGVVVYGTGWWYRPWIGRVWFGPPLTWGFGFRFGWTSWGGWGWRAGWSWGPVFRPWWGVRHEGPDWWGPRGWRGVHYNINVNVYDHWHKDVIVRNRTLYHVRNEFERREGMRGHTEHSAIEHREFGHPEHGGPPTRGVPERRYVGFRGEHVERGRERSPEAGRKQNNVFAGRDGNVYRHEGQGWELHEHGHWERFQPRQGREEFHSLERQNFARNRGERRTESFRRGGFRRGLAWSDRVHPGGGRR